MKKLIIMIACLAMTSLMASAKVPSKSDKEWNTVVSATSGSLEATGSKGSYKLVMNNVDTGIAFAKHPNKEMKSVSVEEIVALWVTGSLSKNPPNAVLGLTVGEKKTMAAILSLLNANYDATSKTLTFTAVPLGSQNLGSQMNFTSATLMVGGVIHSGG